MVIGPTSPESFEQWLVVASVVALGPDLRLTRELCWRSEKKKEGKADTVQSVTNTGNGWGEPTGRHRSAKAPSAR